MSSMEAELIALTEATKTVVYLRKLMSLFGYPQHSPTPIGVDNQSVLAVSKSVMIAWKNRHIPLRYFKVRELIKNGDVELYYVSSADNDSDLLTKSLSRELFEKHRSSMVFEVPIMDFEKIVPIFTG